MPAAGARLDGVLSLVGELPADAVGLLVRWAGQVARQVPIDHGAFAHQLPLGRADHGPTELELWTVASDGTRQLWQRRQVTLARQAPPWRGLGTRVWGAADKAVRAWRAGRLSADPRQWLYLWRRHLAESAEMADAETRLAPARQAIDAKRVLGALLDGNQRVTVPSSASPRVTVIIVVYKRPELLLAALRSLPDQDLEVVLVDNASGPETARLLDRIDGAVLVRNTDNRGFLLAVNQAAALAQGDVLLLLNSDAELRPGALAFGLAALVDGVGAVGGKLIHPDGCLQEAGATLGPDGSAVAIGRGAPADDPAYDVRRDCDYVSGALLLTPRKVFVSEGGFDEAFAPAYYEDADYCVRLWKRGLKVVYEPDFAADHLEFGSAASPSQALLAQAQRRPQLVAKHAAWLAKHHRTTGPRVLFIDDRLPYRRHGAGHPRAGSIVRALAELGCAVTVYPTLFPADEQTLDLAARRAELPSSIERVPNRGSAGLGAFLAERTFDVIVVSRAHNLALIQRLLPSPPPLIYDAEALTTDRDRRLAALTGTPLQPGLEMQIQADLILAVSDLDAAALRQAGHRTRTLGHALQPRPTPRGFAQRAGVLFVGAFAGLGSPNADAVSWFATAIWPQIRTALGPVWLTVAGARMPPELLALDALSPDHGVELRGEVSAAELEALYDQARIFVAPLRAAAGLPYKIHEAAAHGLPVVTTPLLAEQLGWQDELAIASTDDFAAKVIALYQDPVAWSARRAAALARVTSDCDPARFQATLSAALAEVRRG